MVKQSFKNYPYSFFFFQKYHYHPIYSTFFHHLLKLIIIIFARKVIGINFPNIQVISYVWKKKTQTTRIHTFKKKEMKEDHNLMVLEGSNAWRPKEGANT